MAAPTCKAGVVALFTGGVEGIQVAAEPGAPQVAGGLHLCHQRVGRAAVVGQLTSRQCRALLAQTLHTLLHSCHFAGLVLEVGRVLRSREVV